MTGSRIRQLLGELGHPLVGQNDSNEVKQKCLDFCFTYEARTNDGGTIRGKDLTRLGEHRSPLETMVDAFLDQHGNALWGEGARTPGAGVLKIPQDRTAIKERLVRIFQQLAYNRHPNFRAGRRRRQTKANQRKPRTRQSLRVRVRGSYQANGLAEAAAQQIIASAQPGVDDSGHDDDDDYEDDETDDFDDEEFEDHDYGVYSDNDNHGANPDGNGEDDDVTFVEENTADVRKPRLQFQVIVSEDMGSSRSWTPRGDFWAITWQDVHDELCQLPFDLDAKTRGLRFVMTGDRGVNCDATLIYDQPSNFDRVRKHMRDTILRPGGFKGSEVHFVEIFPLWKDNIAGIEGEAA